MTFPSDFSRANLKVGRSSPERSGSGTLFMKLGSPAAAGFAAATAAAASAEPIRTSRRCTLDIMIISMMPFDGDGPKPGTRGGHSLRQVTLLAQPMSQLGQKRRR